MCTCMDKIWNYLLRHSPEPSPGLLSSSPGSSRRCRSLTFRPSCLSRVLSEKEICLIHFPDLQKMKKELPLSWKILLNLNQFISSVIGSSNSEIRLRQIPPTTTHRYVCTLISFICRLTFNTVGDLSCESCLNVWTIVHYDFWSYIKRDKTLLPPSPKVQRLLLPAASPPTYTTFISYFANFIAEMNEAKNAKTKTKILYFAKKSLRFSCIKESIAKK